MGVISEDWRKSSTGRQIDAFPFVMSSIEARHFMRCLQGRVYPVDLKTLNIAVRDSTISFLLKEDAISVKMLHALCDYMIEDGWGNRDVRGGILSGLKAQEEEAGNKEAATLRQRINALIDQKDASISSTATNSLPQRIVSL